MMKFFRKYTKTLLAVFMALLLIVWLGGEALTTMFNKDRDVSSILVGQAFGQPVKQGELTRADVQSSVGRALIPYWDAPWIDIFRRMGLDRQSLQSLSYRMRRTPLKLEEWYLLDAEAKRNGAYVPQDVVEQIRRSMPGEKLAAIRDMHKLSIDQIDQTIRAYLRVEQTALQAADAVVVSEADIQDFIRQTAEKVKAEFVVLDPNKLIDKSYQPTEAEIKAQFEKYKDKPAGRGAGDFGYQLPDATQLEYIEINVDEIARLQAVSEYDAYEYWVAHKDEFPKPVPPPPPSSAPASQPTPKPYETFVEAGPDVVKKLQHDKAVQIAGTLATDLARQLAAQPATQPAAATSRPGATQPASESLYEKTLAGLKNNKYYSTMSYGRTKLLSQSELSSDPKLGRTSAFAGAPSEIRMPQLAFMVQGLKSPTEPAPGQASLSRKLYETCREPVSDSKGDMFVFRNVAVRPAQAPASIDADLKAKLVEGVRYERATAEAEKLARELAEQARKVGLKTAFDRSDLAKKLDKTAFVQPEPFARKQNFSMGGMSQLYGGFIMGVGYDPQLVDLCFDLASRVTTTQPSPIAVHEQQQGGKWTVVEFEKLLPVTRDEYNQERERARQQLLSQKRIQFVIDWFAEANIYARTGWHEEKSGDKDGPEKPDDKQAEK